MPNLAIIYNSNKKVIEVNYKDNCNEMQDTENTHTGPRLGSHTAHADHLHDSTSKAQSQLAASLRNM